MPNVYFFFEKKLITFKKIICMKVALNLQNILQLFIINRIYNEVQFVIESWKVGENSSGKQIQNCVTIKTLKHPYYLQK